MRRSRDDYVDDVVKKQKKISREVSIGSVEELENLRQDFEMSTMRNSDHENLIEMCDAMDSAEEISDIPSLENLFDGSFDDFKEFVNGLNKDAVDAMPDNLKTLFDMADILNRLKRDGVLKDLVEEEFISKDEKSILGSSGILEDIAEDFLSSVGANVLMSRISGDLSASLETVRRKFSDVQYKYNIDDDPAVRDLQDLGIVEHNDSRGVMRTPRRDNREGKSQKLGTVSSGGRSRQASTSRRDDRRDRGRDDRRRDRRDDRDDRRSRGRIDRRNDKGSRRGGGRGRRDEDRYGRSGSGPNRIRAILNSMNDGRRDDRRDGERTRRGKRYRDRRDDGRRRDNRRRTSGRVRDRGRDDRRRGRDDRRGGRTYHYQENEVRDDRRRDGRNTVVSGGRQIHIDLNESI